MTKKYFLLILLAVGFSLNAQTTLVSQPLELHKSKYDHQFYTVSDEKNLFAFASDKDSVFAFQYNSAVFLKEKLKATRPHKSFRNVAGQTVSTEGNSHLYWVSEDFMKVETQFFDFKNNQVTSVETRLSFKDEKMLLAFSSEKTFYIVSVLDKAEQLKFYSFNNGTLSEIILDFEPFTFLSPSGKSATLNELFKDFPVEFINEKIQQPLMATVAPIKIYARENDLIFTFEQAAQTQAFIIDLNEKTIVERKFSKVNFEKPGNSNSFLNDDKLYQIKLNEDALNLQAFNFENGEKINSYQVSKQESIEFKNSPLLLQTENRRTKELKNTDKMLSRLSNADIGISVYKTPNHHFVTVGGTKFVASTGGVIAGITLAVAAGIATGGDYGLGLYDDYNFQSIFFESLFDENFNHNKDEQKMLASDSFSGFLASNKIQSYSYVPFQDYFVLSYYDQKARQFVLRKFEDFKN